MPPFMNSLGKLIVSSAGYPIDCSQCPCESTTGHTEGCCDAVATTLNGDNITLGAGICTCTPDFTYTVTESTSVSCTWRSTTGVWQKSGAAGGCNSFGAPIQGSMHVFFQDVTTGAVCERYILTAELHGPGISVNASYSTSFPSTYVHENGWTLPFDSGNTHCTWPASVTIRPA